MSPLSFDPKTAREVIGDTQARLVEAKARLDADSVNYNPPIVTGNTYWSQVMSQMQNIVYTVQYDKRIARLQRKSLLQD